MARNRAPLEIEDGPATPHNLRVPYYWPQPGPGQWEGRGRPQGPAPVGELWNAGLRTCSLAPDMLPAALTGTATEFSGPPPGPAFH